MKTMKDICNDLDQKLIRGMTYDTPGETTMERESSKYCLQPGSHCHTCSLVNYNLDCRNNKVESSVGCRRC
jgi:hypothetical protein